MLDSSPGRTMSAVPISFGAVIVLMLSVSQASSAVVPSQAQVQPSTANQSTVANSDDSDLSARFKELQLEYNKTLLNDNLVTEIDKCNSLSAFKEESKVKILCSVYFDMLDGLSAANVSFGGPDKVTEAIRKYSNIESSKTFCDSFKAELLIKEDRRAFSQRTFAANKHLLEALQSSDKCALLCTVMDKDANISVKPFCSVSVEGFRLIKAAEKDVALTKPQNATNNRTAVSQSADLASQKDTSASDVKTAAPLSVPSITANKKTSESSTKGNGVEQNGKPPVLPIKDGIVKATTIPDSKLRQDELEGELEGEEVEDENPETGAGNQDPPTDKPLAEPVNQFENVKPMEISKLPISNDGDQTGENSALEGETGDDGSNFLAYLIFLMFLTGISYVGYHNKTKVLALVIEGRRGRRYSRNGGRRRHSAEYRRLDSNLEEAIQSNSQVHVTQIIY